MSTKIEHPKGYWVLLDENGNETEFFTMYLAETYIEKATKRKFTKGPIQIVFPKKGKYDIPPLIEETDDFEFIIGKPKKLQQGLTIAEEVYVNMLLKDLFKKKK